MRAEEAEFAISRIAAAAAQRAGNPDEKLRLVTQQLAESPSDDQALLMQTIGARAAEDPACGQLLLLLADVSGFKTWLGSEKLERLRQALAGQPQGAVVERYLRSLPGVDPARLPLFRAKTGIMLQTLSMVNDRLESKRLPLLRLNGYEVAERVLSQSGLEDTRVRVELRELNSQALDAARDVLLEADFEEVDEDCFETSVTDEQLGILGQASGLGRVLGAGRAATLPEAVAQRQALVIVKRFCLLCRSATMYPPDHPSLPPAFEAFRDMIERAIEDREQITLTVLTGDILLDDVKIRREDRIKKTFVDLFDERQVASVTFRQGLTVDEVKALVYCFTVSPKMVRDSGGVRAILTRKKATNIVVDQFRYRVVADDGTTQAEAYPGAPGDRLLESLIYAHVLEKIEKGGSLQALSVEEVGAFFKDLLTSPDEDKRRALARLLITLDPGLLERGFLANPELRQSLSWSAARKALDLMFRDLADSDHETKEQALDTIAQLTDLAITRHKETTVAVVTKRLGEYIATQESDPDLLRKATHIYASMAIAYLRRRKLDKSAEFVSLLWQVARGQEKVSLGQDETAPVLDLAADTRDEVVTAAREGLAVVGGEDDVVDLLIQAVGDPDTVRNQPASGMLEALGTDVVVTRLFRLFLDRDRSVRSRAYRLLKKIGPRSLSLIRNEIEERRLPTHPGRDPSTGLFQDESEWYILRNCLDLLAEMDPIAAGPLLAEMATDPDHRVRRESLRLIARHVFPGVTDTLRSALADPRGEVREAAVAALGVFRDEDAVDPLVALVYRHPEHRKIALEALGRIGSIRAADFLITALDALDMTRGQRQRRKKLKIIRDFPADHDAMLQAIAALGAIGGSEVENRVEEFLDHWSSPLRRLAVRSGLKTPARDEILNAARNALALARRKKPETTPTTGTDRLIPRWPGGRGRPAGGRHSAPGREDRV
ncbi:MAG: HEAT repeat domain-containing protein [Candidatus Rokuibacteriota bacterium]